MAGTTDIQDTIHNTRYHTQYPQCSLSKHWLKCSLLTSYSRFPYQEDTVNEWFALVSGDDWPQRDIGEAAVNAMNVDEDGQKRKCYRNQHQVENAFPESLEDEEFEIFFHGTSHKSAVNIIEKGIDVGKGNEQQDFSDLDGFYLSKNFEEALAWTRSRRGRSIPRPAVLVFRVKRTELRGNNNEKGLDLRDPEKKKEWQEVVSQFRTKPSSKFRKNLNRNYQFIEGPMASVSSKRPTRVSHPVQQDGTYQLCVRKDDCAELFDRSLHSVVFF